MPYNREAARDYALKWAYGYNPDFYNFDKLGGDCTNFASQVLYAGGLPMNYTPTFGWYYRSLNDRAPAWTGVNEFYRFLTTNTGIGPKAREVGIDEIQQQIRGLQTLHVDLFYLITLADQRDLA